MVEQVPWMQLIGRKLESELGLNGRVSREKPDRETDLA